MVEVFSSSGPLVSQWGVISFLDNPDGSSFTSFIFFPEISLSELLSDSEVRDTKWVMSGVQNKGGMHSPKKSPAELSTFGITFICYNYGLFYGLKAKQLINSLITPSTDGCLQIHIVCIVIISSCKSMDRF